MDLESAKSLASFVRGGLKSIQLALPNGTCVRCGRSASRRRRCVHAARLCSPAPSAERAGLLDELALDGHHPVHGAGALR